MIAQGESPLFSFNGKHCDDFDVTFLPSAYPFIPVQSIPQTSVGGRHGTLRWKGRTFSTKRLKGKLYFLNTLGDDTPIPTDELLRRASDVTAWLCGTDGRGKLILDALPDRYFIAEVSDASSLTDDDWASGEAAIAFTCQPFAYAVSEDGVTVQTSANAAKSAALGVQGNAETMLAFRVTCASGTMNTATVETPTCRFNFTGLGMTAGETLVARYAQEDILLLEIEGVDGGTRSAMAMRTTDSDDDLLLSPGRNAVTVKTEKACSVHLTARGRYL